jgi:hypothetical protein
MKGGVINTKIKPKSAIQLPFHSLHLELYYQM